MFLADNFLHVIIIVMSFAGKVVLITGASRGLGATFAKVEHRTFALIVFSDVIGSVVRLIN